MTEAMDVRARVVELWFFYQESVAGIPGIEMPGPCEFTGCRIGDDQVWITVRADWIPVVPIGSAVPQYRWHDALPILRQFYDDHKKAG